MLECSVFEREEIFCTGNGEADFDSEYQDDGMLFISSQSRSRICWLPTTLSLSLYLVIYQNAPMDFTADQLLQYNGTNPSNPIYVAIKGRVFDVTTGKSFYGPGGSYAMFAGKDASRALAKMSKNDEDISSSLHGLTEKEIGVLDDWEKKFEAKYPVVGRVVS